MKTLNKPLVTLAICNYNRSHYLRRSIQSCLSQLVNRRHIEVIVVDDGSTDGSVSICNEFKTEITLVRHQKNLGIGAASNTALQNSKGDYFMRVDSDDYISSELVSTYAPVLDYNQDIDYVYGDLLKIDRSLEVKQRIRLDQPSIVKRHGAGVLFRTQSLIKVGGYNKNLRNSEDYDLITRLISAKSQGFYYPAPLYRYYQSENNLTDQKAIRKKLENKIERKHNV